MDSEKYLLVYPHRGFQFQAEYYIFLICFLKYNPQICLHCNDGSINM